MNKAQREKMRRRNAALMLGWYTLALLGTFLFIGLMFRFTPVKAYFGL